MSSGDVNLASVYQTSVTPANYTPGMAIAAGAVYSSGLLQNAQQSTIAVGANLSVGGALSIQRYVDNAGLIPQGSATSLSLSAGVAASVTVGDGAPFLSYVVTVTPGGNAAATLTTLAITLRAAGVVGGTTGNPFVFTPSSGLGTSSNPLIEQDANAGFDNNKTYVRDTTTHELLALMVAQMRLLIEQMMTLNNDQADPEAMIAERLARFAPGTNPFV